MIEGKRPLVSILCITYNHEKYIAQAIEGFLMQKTNFQFEIIIHDDASTDKNVEIIKTYQVNYPELFNCIFQTENQYSKKNGSIENAIFGAAKGKYIAICEGDDYWIDSLKLQKQVDFLEMNSEYGLVYSKVQYFHQSKNKFGRNSWGGAATSFDQLIMANQIPTLTVVLRNDLLRQYLKDIQLELKDWKMGDYPMWLYVALKSKIHFINEVTAVYRVLDESASHNNDLIRQESFIKSHFEIKQFFYEFGNIKYDKDNFEDDLLARLATNALLQRDIKLAIAYFNRSNKLSKNSKIKLIICKSRVLSFIFRLIN